MRAFNIPIPALPTQLSVLLGDTITQCSVITMQSPKANTNTVFFGDAKMQPFELFPQSNAQLAHVTNSRSVYVKGTPPDRLSVGLF